MKITVTFDSLEEFQQYIGAQQVTPQAPAEEPKAPKPEKKPKKEEKPAEEPAAAPEVPFEESKPEAPAVTMEQVRKLLADLNKKAGKNVAKELIKQVGYKKLTDVPEGALPTLKNLAEEEATKYA